LTSSFTPVIFHALNDIPLLGGGSGGVLLWNIPLLGEGQGVGSSKEVVIWQ